MKTYLRDTDFHINDVKVTDNKNFINIFASTNNITLPYDRKTILSYFLTVPAAVGDY